MTVKELIEKLIEYDGDAIVSLFEGKSEEIEVYSTEYNGNTYVILE